MFRVPSRKLLSLSCTALLRAILPTHLVARRVKSLPRLHGTVYGFKHRRGYGFVKADGFVEEPPVNFPISLDKLMTQYFFTRGSLSGGFYLNEGDRVSFEVWERKGALPELVSSDASSQSRGYVPLQKNETKLATNPKVVKLPDADTSTTGGQLHLAMRIRFYDKATQKETHITPVTLCGKVIEWDPIEGRGIVSELDMDGNFHQDAPRFVLTLDELDVSPGTEMRPGRYVRFCSSEEYDPNHPHLSPLSTLDLSDGEDKKAAAILSVAGSSPQSGVLPTSPPLACRVIIDQVTERKNAAIGVPLAPASAPHGTVNEATRFSGTVRAIESNFGFVKDDLEGESIFFHLTNVASSGLQPGEKVTYLLRMLTTGKHAGKKACFDVRRMEGSKERSEAEEIGRPLSRSLDDDVDDDLDLLD